jgi:hypothetical protein
MEFSGDGVSVYAEAKGEYTRQLSQYLTPVLQKYFLDMIDIAKEREAEPKKHLISFQTLLEGVSEWNMDKVQRETQAIAISTQCDYLEELLTAVFIAHTKVLSAIRLTNKNKKLQITIPKLEHFLHRTLTECSRLLWRNTFLFATTGSALERQKNMCQIENLIKEGVLQGVRSMLPVKSILREYLSTDDTDTEADDDDDDDEEEEEEEDEEPVAKSKKAGSNKPSAVIEVPTGPSSSQTGPSSSPTGPSSSMESLKTEIAMFNPKEIDISVPNDPARVTTPSRSSTPPPSRPSTPAIPTIVLDGVPKVDFNEINTFFPPTTTENNTKVSDTPVPVNEVVEEVDLNTLEEFDMSGMEESTTLDFTEFEEL